MRTTHSLLSLMTNNASAAGRTLMRLFAGVVAFGCLLEVARGESEFLEQFKFSGGIVVAIDIDDGEFLADLATDKPFVIHSLLSEEAKVAASIQDMRIRPLRGTMRALRRYM